MLLPLEGKRCSADAGLPERAVFGTTRERNRCLKGRLEGPLSSINSITSIKSINSIKSMIGYGNYWLDIGEGPKGCVCVYIYIYIYIFVKHAPEAPRAAWPRGPRAARSRRAGARGPRGRSSGPTQSLAHSADKTPGRAITSGSLGILIEATCAPLNIA